jgi:hypothetical protein
MEDQKVITEEHVLPERFSVCLLPLAMSIGLDHII